MAAQAAAEDDDWWQLSREEKRRRTRDAWAASVMEDLDLRIDDDDAVASYGVPASGKAIWELHAPACGEVSEEDRRGGCVVCLEGLEDAGKNLRMMPCGHSFHELCIFKWLVVHRLCPICQFAMPSDEEQRLLDDMEEEARQPVRKKKKKKRMQCSATYRPMIDHASTHY